MPMNKNANANVNVNVNVAADIAATEEQEFQTALRGLIRSGSQRRKALVKAFRLSLNAVINRADTTRLTALTEATAEDADASKIRKAACGRRRSQERRR